MRLPLATLLLSALPLACTPLRHEAQPTPVPPCAQASDCPPEHAAGSSGRGLADYHLHQMAEAAFGGAWVWGASDGPPAQALRGCSGRGVDHGFLAGTEGPFLNLGRHEPGGYPDFQGWPRWNSISHQQAHAAWLKQAHEQGLDLMVMSAVEQVDFCELLPEDKRTLPCDDFASVKRQLQMAQEFEDRHGDWYQLVYSPAEAREAIAAGRLAVVLAVESGDVFDGGDPLARLGELQAMGVRALQPVHETDNRFAGAAWHDPPLLALQVRHYREHPEEREAQKEAKRQSRREEGRGRGGGAVTAAARLSGFDLDDEGRNRRGLSEEGRALVREMMRLEMILDVSHLSERAIEDSYLLSADNGHYPLFVSHAHFSDLEPTEVGEWSYSIAPYLRVAQTGGVVGMRSSSTWTRTYLGSGVPNDCDGSSKSFAQRLAWATEELGLQVGFATDFGGLASNLSPRFGEDACAEAPSGAKARQQAAQTGSRGLDLDTRGFGHVGMLGEVMQELEAVGADTSALSQGAEAFIQMWERVESASRGPLPMHVDPEAARASLR